MVTSILGLASALAQLAVGFFLKYLPKRLLLNKIERLEKERKALKDAKNAIDFTKFFGSK